MINDFGLRKEGFKSRSGRSRSLRRGEEQHESEQITSSLCQIFGVPHLQVSGKSFGNASLCSLGTNCRYCTRSGEAVSLDTLDSSPQSRGRRFLHNSSFLQAGGAEPQTWRERRRQSPAFSSVQRMGDRVRCCGEAGAANSTTHRPVAADQQSAAGSSAHGLQP